MRFRKMLTPLILAMGQAFTHVDPDEVGRRGLTGRGHPRNGVHAA
jgi:hypothetical protein